MFGIGVSPSAVDALLVTTEGVELGLQRLGHLGELRCCNRSGQALDEPLHDRLRLMLLRRLV
eukprot:8587254-Pyramimonas_sp.AAC.1